LPDKRPIGQGGIFLQLAQGDGFGKLQQKAKIGDGRLRVIRIGPAGSDDFSQADDGRFAAGMVDEDTIFRLHGADGLRGLGITDPIPERLPVGGKLLDGVIGGIGFGKEVLHGLAGCYGPCTSTADRSYQQKGLKGNVRTLRYTISDHFPRNCRSTVRMKSLFTLTLLLFSAFGQQPATTPAPTTSVQEADAKKMANDAAVKTEFAAPVDPATYRIGPEDILQLKVFREPELSGQFVVRPDGKVNLSYVGELQAGGLSPLELEKKIIEKLSEMIKKPEVSLQVLKVESRKYFVSGEVLRSGSFPLVTPTTVLQAISLCGLREFANPKKIVIMRGTTRMKFNYREVIKGKKPEQNLLLENGDHIVVP
jgi:polysaccharide biosynthesis/export protein